MLFLLFFYVIVEMKIRICCLHIARLYSPFKFDAHNFLWAANILNACLLLFYFLRRLAYIYHLCYHVILYWIWFAPLASFLISMTIYTVQSTYDVHFPLFYFSRFFLFLYSFLFLICLRSLKMSTGSITRVGL